MAPTNSILSMLLVPLLAVSANAQTPATSVPTDAITATYTYAAATLSAPTYSYAFTVTTATTFWAAPTFAPAASPIPACADTMCPAFDKKRCVDSQGIMYGILCDTRFAGITITNAGKKMMGKEKKRSYEASFDNCAQVCDLFNSTLCLGFEYQNGHCMPYDAITGSFPTVGEIAAVRQS